LKRIVGDQALDIDMLGEVARGNFSPRSGGAELCSLCRIVFGVSERRASVENALDAALEGIADAADRRAALERAAIPRGRPTKGTATSFYRQLAADYHAFKLAGKRPAEEIARREGVPRNTVDQWLHRARHRYHLLPGGS
jgi:hypothetical protein